ncbi:putative xyloglucan endotransglucosylase/hydrolase protein 29 [Drosera capensis]
MGWFQLILVLVFSVLVIASCNEENDRNLPIISFEEGYSHLFGGDNLMVLRDGKAVHLSLDERSGSGFMSHDIYLHGFFSASVKLPADYTAGIVVAFYMSNGDTYEENHDEIDFEFLGNIRGKDWRIQTNMYGNGSTSVGREERYDLWFDPSEDFHQYSILWTEKHIIIDEQRFLLNSYLSLKLRHSDDIAQNEALRHSNDRCVPYDDRVIKISISSTPAEVMQLIIHAVSGFYVDDVVIREIERTEAMGGDFPSKPMSLYATIWDGSNWATNGGKYRVNYKYAPYVARFSDFVLHGCAVDPMDSSLRCEKTTAPESFPETITPKQRQAMQNFRMKHMSYSYCYDRVRYKVPPPECVIDPQVADKLRRSDGLTFGGAKRRHGRRQRHHRSHSEDASA